MDIRKVAATPLTNVRFTGNPEGVIDGYEQSLDDAFMNRIENTTPFKGLFLASAGGGNGGGYQPCLQAGLNDYDLGDHSVHRFKNLPDILSKPVKLFHHRIPVR